MERLDFCTAAPAGTAGACPVTLDAVYGVLADAAYRICHPPILDSLVLAVTADGEGTVRINGRSLVLRAGSAALLEVSSGPFAYWCSEKSWRFWWFEFRCDDPGFVRLAPDTAVSSDPSLLPLCEKTLGYLKLGERHSASLLLASILCMLQLPLTCAGSTDLFQRADRYIRQNLATVTVAAVAAHLQVSERTLLNAFRSLLHISTFSYIRQVKMETAQLLLCLHDLSVKELAEKLGYSDPFVFSKAFHRCCGVAPGQYRRAQTALPAKAPPDAAQGRAPLHNCPPDAAE